MSASSVPPLRDRAASLPTSIDLLARALMSLLFLLSGLGKLTAIGATQRYMQAYGVPGALIWPAAAWEIGAAGLFTAGAFVRPLAVLMAGWCLLTAGIFHTAWGDPTQQVMFLKNVTMAGGFLLAARSGAAGLSVDGVRLSSSGDAR